METESINSETAQMCGVDYAFKRIGGKYKGRILWYLHAATVLRYGELRRILPDITTKMLTQTLRELENDKLVTREVYHVVPPKVEYSLSDIGMELIPFIEYLHNWGNAKLGKETLPIPIITSTCAQQQLHKIKESKFMKQTNTQRLDEFKSGLKIKQSID